MDALEKIINGICDNTLLLISLILPIHMNHFTGYFEICNLICVNDPKIIIILYVQLV